MLCHLWAMFRSFSIITVTNNTRFSFKMAVQVDLVEINRDENFGLGCALEMFTEHEEVIRMIEELKKIYTSPVSIERSYERFRFIVSQYQEQPHLMDPYLDAILDKLISIVRYGDSSMELKHATFQYLHIIMKVRGYKVVVRHLPHEVRKQHGVCLDCHFDSKLTLINL